MNDRQLACIFGHYSRHSGFTAADPPAKLYGLAAAAAMGPGPARRVCAGYRPRGFCGGGGREEVELWAVRTASEDGCARHRPPPRRPQPPCGLLENCVLAVVWGRVDGWGLST